MEGIVDRFEDDRVIVEVGDKLLIFKRSLFPETLKEGDMVIFKEGHFLVNEKRTEDRKEYIDNLFDSLIDKEDK